jgi:hypothetical protein
MQCSVTFQTQRPIPSYNVQVQGTAVVNNVTSPIQASIVGVAHGVDFTMTTNISGLNIRQFIPQGTPPQGCTFTL